MCRLSMTSLLACLWLMTGSCQGNGSLQDSMSQLHTEFAVSLYQRLTETENKSNLIVSPVSVSLSLGLLQLGARRNTLAQLEAGLGYNANGRSAQCTHHKHWTQGVKGATFCLGTPLDVGSTRKWMDVMRLCAWPGN